MTFTHQTLAVAPMTLAPPAEADTAAGAATRSASAIGPARARPPGLGAIPASGIVAARAANPRGAPASAHLAR